jgi:hypothetical protein
LVAAKPQDDIDYTLPADKVSARWRLHLAGAWAPRSVGFEYAKWQLAQITTHHLEQGLEVAHPEAEARMLHHLRSLVQPGTLYPTMSIDDGDVIAEWRVDDYGLDLLTTPSQAQWTLRRRGVRISRSTSILELKTLLASLTEAVDRINPDWPALFPQASQHTR